MKLTKTLIIILILSVGHLRAQDALPAVQVQQPDTGKHGLRNFFLTGNGFANFEKISNEEKPLLHSGLYPILLWQASDKLFFEVEVEIEAEDSEIKTNIEYATFHYSINKYFIIGGGKFLSPFGTFQERLHPRWINKLPEAPLGFSHEGTAVGPMSELGFEMRGGSAIGNSKINYTAYVSNGPVLITETSDTLMGGMLEDATWKDNNNNKAIGGRMGFLPFSNSSLEVGLSRQNAKVGNPDDSLFSKAKAVMHAFDVNYVKSVITLKGIMDIKGQFNHVMIDETDSSSIINMDTMNNSSAMFNISKAYYLQFSFRPALLEHKIIKNLELCTRYSAVSMSEMRLPRKNKSEISLGINYWFSWRSVVKFAYQASWQNGKKEESVFLIQLAIVHPRINFKRRKEEKK